MFKEKRLLFIKVYRLKDWWYFLGLIVLGFFFNRSPSFFYFLTKILISGLLLAFAFSWNEFFDKKFPRKKIIFPLIPLFLILFSLNILNQKNKILTFLFLLVALLYSLPPIRLKSYPFIGTFCNAFGFSLLFLIGANNFKNNLIWPIYFGLFSLLFVAQLIHELEHALQDKSARILTTAIFLGERRTKFLIIFFLLLGDTSFLRFSLFVTIISLIYSLYIIILLIKNINYSSLRKIYRYTGLAFGIILLLYLLFII